MAVSKDDVVAAAVFKALADSTRRGILEDLSKGELAAGELASRFPISGPSVSRHLAVLKAAGLVTERRSANKVIYSLAGDHLVSYVGEFVSRVCPEPSPARRQGKKKAKAAVKNTGKAKRKAPPPADAPPAVVEAARAPAEAAAHREGAGHGPLNATV
jgi:DNA-binding transcriptional ArsR family regulator